MNAGEAYSFVQFLANKSSSGGFINPSYFTDLMQRAEMEFVFKNFNNNKQYVRGSSTPVYAFGMTQKMRDNMRPYKKVYQFSSLVNGTSTLPDDYLHPIGFFASYYSEVSSSSGSSESMDKFFPSFPQKNTTITYSNVAKTVEVKLLEDDEYGSRLNSVTRPVNNEYPIAKFVGNTAYFAPSTTLQPVLHYIKKPIGAVFGYTLDANGDAVYNPSTSKSWEAPDDCHNELCIMICQYVGIHVDSDSITAFSQYKETTGI